MPEVENGTKNTNKSTTFEVYTAILDIKENNRKHMETLIWVYEIST